MDEAGLPGNKRQRINAHGSRWDQTGMNDVNGGTVSQPWRSQSPGQINQAHQQPQNYTPPQGQFVHGYPTLPFHPPIMPAWNFAPPMQFNPVFEFAPQFPPQQAMVWPNQNQQSALQEHARQQCNNDIYLEGIKEGEQRAEKRHTSKVQEYELRLREKDIECERKLKGLAAHQTGIKEGERRAEQRRNNMVQTYERRLKNKDTKLEQKLKGLECRYETRVQEARSEARREALKEFAPVQPQRNPHPQGIPLTRIYDQPPYPVLSYEERVDLAINARTHRSDSIEVVVGGSTSCDDDTRKEMNGMCLDPFVTLIANSLEDAIASRVAAWEKQNQA